jgi:gluconate 2-dehydrogenase gamma chain
VIPEEALARNKTRPPARPTEYQGFESLVPIQAEVLEALVDRIVPSDESGPGAKEAQVVRYIDRSLSGALSGMREKFCHNLTAVESLAQKQGSSFAKLSPEAQDLMLKSFEKGAGQGFVPDSREFFGTVRWLTIEGMFSDPFYGGNANFVGWDLIGYPGIRLAVSDAEQRLEVHIKPEHRSAYGFGFFSEKGTGHGHGH